VARKSVSGKLFQNSRRMTGYLGVKVRSRLVPRNALALTALLPFPRLEIDL
jgi:hypothetical protein